MDDGTFACDELQRFRDVMMAPPGGAGAGAAASSSDETMLGAPMGYFDVEDLEAKGRKRIPRSDGVYTDPNGPEPGRRYGPEYRAEIIDSQRVMRDHPYYQFLQLAVGSSGRDVDKFFNDAAVQREVRSRLEVQEAQQQIQETVQSREQLEVALRDAKRAKANDVASLNGLRTNRGLDGLLRATPVFAKAYVAYVDAREDTSALIATTAVIEPPSVFVPEDRKAVLDRAVDVVFGDDDAEHDLEPNVGAMFDFAFADISGRPTQGPAGSYGGSLRGALAVAFQRAFGSAPHFAVSALPPIDTPANPILAEAFANAIRWLLLLVLHVPMDEIQKFGASYRQGDVAAILRLRGIARDRYRAYTDDEDASEKWIREADALIALLRAAYALHATESPLAAITEPMGDVKSAAFLAREAGREARADALRAGKDPAEAFAAATEATRKVLDNPPNYIYATSAEIRTAAGRAIAAAAMLVTAAKAAPGDAVAKLIALGVIGAPALTADKKIPSLPADGRSPHPVWSQAMIWYERLGSSLFERGHSLVAADDAFRMRVGIEFPSTSAQRLAVRGSAVPAWSFATTHPPGFSAQAHGLWDTYARLYASADTKNATAGQRGAAAALPQLTTREKLVFEAVTDGSITRTVPPGATALLREPVFFLARLLDADYAVKIATAAKNLAMREERITALTTRLSTILEGTPRPAQRPVELPYEHDPDWAFAPENTGFVLLDGTVVAALQGAWELVLQYAPDVATRIGSMENLMLHDTLRGTFAEIVGAKRAENKFDDPTSYRSVRALLPIKTKIRGLLRRLRGQFVVAPAFGGPPVREPDMPVGTYQRVVNSQVVAHVRPLTAPRDAFHFV